MIKDLEILNTLSFKSFQLSVCQLLLESFIDKAGLKGIKIGDAEISPIHANFFVNHGKAKAKDIVKLIRLARETVQGKFGIMLDLEVKTLGFKMGTFDV